VRETVFIAWLFDLFPENETIPPIRNKSKRIIGRSAQNFKNLFCDKEIHALSRGVTLIHDRFGIRMRAMGGEQGRGGGFPGGGETPPDVGEDLPGRRCLGDGARTVGLRGPLDMPRVRAGALRARDSGLTPTLRWVYWRREHGGRNMEINEFSRAGAVLARASGRWGSRPAGRYRDRHPFAGGPS
jgi:hypothetical protein